MYGEPSLNFIEQECPYVLSDGTAPRTAGQTVIHVPCLLEKRSMEDASYTRVRLEGGPTFHSGPSFTRARYNLHVCNSVLDTLIFLHILTVFCMYARCPATEF